MDINQVNNLLKINISIEEFESIKDYIIFLLDYNNKINLIGKSTIKDIWNRHVIDCLQLIKLIKNKDIKLADLGTGAGLPGILLSIIGIKEVHLFEKSPKKCQFLEIAKKFSKNKIFIHNVNLQNVNDKTYDCIVSRALGNLDFLLEISKNIKKSEGELIFQKGKKVFEEIEDAKKYWKFDYELYDSLTSIEGKIIKIFDFLK
jgi:16S rRNA (guanine527-N7)-methyltransferase